MLTRLISVLGRHPDVAIDHLGNYLELLGVETSQYRRYLVKKIVALGVFALATSMSILLVALGFMLWGVVEDIHWLIWGVPLIFVLLASGALFKALQPAPETAFSHLRAQVQADAVLLKKILRGEA